MDSSRSFPVARAGHLSAGPETSMHQRNLGHVWRNHEVWIKMIKLWLLVPLYQTQVPNLSMFLAKYGTINNASMLNLLRFLMMLNLQCGGLKLGGSLVLTMLTCKLLISSFVEFVIRETSNFGERQADKPVTGHGRHGMARFKMCVFRFRAHQTKCILAYACMI